MSPSPAPSQERKTQSISIQRTTENGDRIKITGMIYKTGKISLSVSVINKNGKTQKYKFKNDASVSKSGITGLVLTSFKTGLKSAVILSELQIGDETFKVTAIGSGAFSGNKKLKSIELGSSITTIANGAFDGIRSDTTFKLRMTKKQYKTMKKLLKNSGLPKTVKFKRVKP